MITDDTEDVPEMRAPISRKAYAKQFTQMANLGSGHGRGLVFVGESQPSFGIRFAA